MPALLSLLQQPLLVSFHPREPRSLAPTALVISMAHHVNHHGACKDENIVITTSHLNPKCPFRKTTVRTRFPLGSHWTQPERATMA